ncbi:hypothetical protein D3C85_1789640 [compost metagenome]
MRPTLTVSGIFHHSPISASSDTPAMNRKQLRHGANSISAAPASGPTIGAISATLAISAVTLTAVFSSNASCTAA